jgi:hypothetical protein
MPYSGDQSSQLMIETLFDPDWDTIWLYGYLLDQSIPTVYYVNAWMDRDGHGSLLVSQSVQSFAQTPEQRADLIMSEEQLSDGKRISYTVSMDWPEVEGQWQYHPFEVSDRFMSYFFPLDLPLEAEWQLIGESTLAERRVNVLAHGQYRIWIDPDMGTILRLELYNSAERDLPVLSLQVEEIAYQVTLPARTLDVVPTSGYQPTFMDRPVVDVEIVENQPLSFHYVSTDARYPADRQFVDLYQQHDFLGFIDLGSAGFYCGRSADWQYFAFLSQKSASFPKELHWIDLNVPGKINTIEGIQNPCAPVWSPNTLQIAVTGYMPGEFNGYKTYLIIIPCGEIIELGDGSIVPPGWTDDGKFIFSLDETFDNLLFFDAETGVKISSWAFDKDQWQVIDLDAPINNQEISQKLPRSSVNYLDKCVKP